MRLCAPRVCMRPRAGVWWFGGRHLRRQLPARQLGPLSFRHVQRLLPLRRDVRLWAQGQWLHRRPGLLQRAVRYHRALLHVPASRHLLHRLQSVLLLHVQCCRDVLYSRRIAVHDRIGLLQRDLRCDGALRLPLPRGRMRRWVRLLQSDLPGGAVHVPLEGSVLQREQRLLQRGMRRLWAVQLSPSRGRLLARRQQLCVLQWGVSDGPVHVFLRQLRLQNERRMLQRGVRSVPGSLPVVRPAAPAHYGAGCSLNCSSSPPSTGGAALEHRPKTPKRGENPLPGVKDRVTRALLVV
jgi:hypothetical protein